MGDEATYDDAVRYGQACEREFARRYLGCTVETIIRDHVEGTGSGAYSDDIDIDELHDVR